VVDSLSQVAERASGIRSRLLEHDSALQNLRALESKLDQSFQSSPYFQVQTAAREAWDDSLGGLGSEQKKRWGDCLLSDLIARVGERLPRFPTPESIFPHLAYQFSRILKEIEKEPKEPRDLGNDRYLKDLALCRLSSFPCVAQVVDKNSAVPRRVIAKNFFRAPAAALALGLHSGFRYAPAFEVHTHTPMLKGFTPEGWDQCYLLAADLLEMYPQHVGLIGGTWFYDPELDRVSPKLSFLRKRPLSGGAFLLPMGQGPSDVSNSTARSQDRRRMYEAGEYNPTSWMFIWPRQALLDWARVNRPSISSKSCSEN
jgi:hypothetical protein